MEEIKTALLGSPLLPQEGLIARFQGMERRLDRWERSLERAKFALMGGLFFGSYGLVELISDIIRNVL